MWDNIWYQTLVDIAWPYMDILAANGQSLNFYFVILIHTCLVKRLAMNKQTSLATIFTPFRYLNWTFTVKMKKDFVRFSLRLSQKRFLRYLTSENSKISSISLSCDAIWVLWTITMAECNKCKQTSILWYSRPQYVTRCYTSNIYYFQCGAKMGPILVH